jgi:CelD/BcsL family acetyltransferase involved in cellulose biosynthesis
MPIELIAPQDLSPDDIAAWTRLQGEGALASPFLSPHWARALARTRGPDAFAPRTGARIAVLREGGEGKAFLAARVGRVTALPVGSPLCDYQGLVAAPGAAIVPRRIVEAFGVHRLDFTSLMMTDAPGLSGCARGAAASHVIDLRAGYDAYTADRAAAGTDILKDTAKKRRKMERELGESVFTAESTSLHDFNQLISWKRAQYAQTGQTDVLAAGWPLELLRSLFERNDPDLRGVMFTLHAGGKLAAVHYALCTPKIAHAWFIAHDDRLQRYSPGVILIDEVTRWVAARGMAELDLGPGDYRFKLSLANRQRQVAHGFVGRLSPATMVRTAQYGVRRAAESLPLGKMSHLPGKAMRRLDLWRGLGGSPSGMGLAG